jgi:hypothetical protein
VAPGRVRGWSIILRLRRLWGYAGECLGTLGASFGEGVADGDSGEAEDE